MRANFLGPTLYLPERLYCTHNITEIDNWLQIKLYQNTGCKKGLPKAKRESVKHKCFAREMLSLQKYVVRASKRFCFNFIGF